MLLNSSVSLWLLVSAFAALLAWAAASDLTRLIIPNRICLGIVVLFPALPLVGAVPVDILGSLLVGVLAFAAGAVLFRFRLLGGGDVKLLAAVSLWAGPSLVLPFVVVTTACGGLLSVIWLIRSRHFLAAVLAASGTQDVRPATTALPYGVAIAAGGLFVAVRLVGL